MPNPSLQQSLSQQQTLAPQMRQSLEILQANTLELQQLLQQSLELNPVLEDEMANVSLDELDGEPTERGAAIAQGSSIGWTATATAKCPGRSSMGQPEHSITWMPTRTAT